MPLPVNGYNKTFTAFVQFAENSIRTGDKKAIANVAETNLGKRKIVASTTDGVGLAGMFRTKFEEGANDNARKLFLNAVTRMFGGRSNIPESVWKAINLQDYGRGAPLRRNIQIIDYADMVLAFWDGTSRGTKFVMDKCREKGKPARFFLIKTSKAIKEGKVRISGNVAYYKDEK